MCLYVSKHPCALCNDVVDVGPLSKSKKKNMKIAKRVSERESGRERERGGLSSEHTACGLI